MEISGQLHALAALPRDKSPPYTLDRRLYGPQSRSGRGGEENKSHHCPCRESNPDHPVPSLVSVLTELVKNK
jgi:hypothetical protein